MDQLALEYVKALGPTGIYIVAIVYLWRDRQKLEERILSLLTETTKQNTLVAKALEDLLEKHSTSSS